MKLLYEKAKEIENQLVNVDYDGNPSNVNRLLDITEKMKNTPEVHIVKLPNLRAILSGYDTFEKVFRKDGFDKWMGVHHHLEKKLFLIVPTLCGMRMVKLFGYGRLQTK